MGATTGLSAHIEQTSPHDTTMVNKRLTGSGQTRQGQKPDTAMLRQLRCVDGLSAKAIARLYGVPPSTVEGWLKRRRIVVSPRTGSYPAIDAMRALLCRGRA